MTQATANKIAQIYIEAGYSGAKALVALADANTPMTDVAKVIDAMEAMGVGL